MDSTFLSVLLTFLREPNVIFMLFIVAVLGLYAEITHPGAMVPGVIGILATLTFLFAAISLSPAPDWFGLLLMLLAFVLLVLDVKLLAHGVLTVGAIVALTFGAFLFLSFRTGPQLSPILVYTVAGIVGVIGFTLVTVLLRTRRLPVRSGVERMIGATVVTLTPLCPEGRVRYGGEDWAAILDPSVPVVEAGKEVQIVFVDGLHLHVVPVMSQVVQERPAKSIFE